MIAVALAALLATAAPDTAVRVPGTTALRFGLSPAAVQPRGFLVQPEEDGAFALQGTARFFGLEARAVLSFDAERLSRVRVEVAAITPRQLDWLEDELRRMGFQRRCAQRSATLRDCEWRGRGAVLAVRAVMGQPGAAGTLAATATCAACGREAAPPASPAPVAASEPGGAVAAPASPAPGAAPDSGGAAAPGVSADRAAVDSAAAAAAPPPCVAPDTLVLAGLGRSDRRDPAGLIEAEAIFRPQLVYPDAARAQGIQGRVWVLARVDHEGVVREAHVTRGIAALDAAALAHVLGTRFRPRTHAGRPCGFRVEVPVVFVMSESRP